jgi:hypothetical protein
MDEKKKEALKAIIRKAKARSPNYPGIDLETAIEKARILREKEGKQYAPVEAALQHWGYVPKSSGGLVTLSALKKFGLTDERGKGTNREIKLSDLALRILLDDREDSVERMQAIQEAALNPIIHRKLWEDYGGELPSHQTLLLKLRKDEGFTDNAAEDLIKEFERTIELAKLKKSDIMSGRREDKKDLKKEDFMTFTSSTLTGDKKSPSKTIEIPIPLSATEWVKIQASYPLSEKSWKQMKNILDAYKPSLVIPETQEKDEKKEG